MSLIPADTAIRGEVEELDMWSAQDLQEIRTDGEGGTDIVDVLHQVVDHYRQAGKRLAHVVYLSDLEAVAPTWETLPPGMPALTFITDAAHADMNFMSAVQSFA
ncbi:VWA-like domain-containing protein, partial [Arthrospira platensis SPKY1]|nr:VWA-like domain-containing protein [Arthrospira platensis SPKY1]